MVRTINDQSVFHLFDHTLLSVTATIDDIIKLCGEAARSGAAAVCVPPCYVGAAKQFLGKSKVRICTVIGYPNGYSTKETKLFECKSALKSGAEEFEIYANIGYIKKRKYDDMQSELTAIRKLCKKNILKLVIDMSVLNSDEQIAVCTIAASSLIDYISIISDADFDGLEGSLKRFKNVIGERAKLKITGNISSIAEAQRLLDAGASRIGETNILSQAHEPAEAPLQLPAEPVQIPEAKVEAETATPEDEDETDDVDVSGEPVDIEIPEEELPVEFGCECGETDAEDETPDIPDGEEVGQTAE